MSNTAITIFVNGTQIPAEAVPVAYEDVAALAGYEKGRPVSMTYSTQRPGTEQSQGTLTAGQSTTLEEGMMFDVVPTDYA